MRRKLHILIISCFLFATISGVFGHGIAHFISLHLIDTPSKYPLIGLTILSIILYILVLILTFKYPSLIKGTKEKVIKRPMVYFHLTLIIGIPVTYWSLYYLSFRWGLFF